MVGRRGTQQVFEKQKFSTCRPFLLKRRHRRVFHKTRFSPSSPLFVAREREREREIEEERRERERENRKVRVRTFVAVVKAFLAPISLPLNQTINKICFVLGEIAEKALC
jgi:hypothetical protein